MINLALLIAMSKTSALAQITTVVDPSVQYQEWEGFGTSLAWWAHIVGAYPEPVRTAMVDKIFRGLQLNVLRYNIGGGEAPALHSMEPRAQVPGYLSSQGTYDWSADAAQRWVLSRGIADGANKFEAFSNSPPYFMTVSGSVTGALGGGDNLQPVKRNAFADYLTTVVKHFSDSWGVHFETLEPMNEPAAPWWTYGNRQEGCHVSPGVNQSNLVIATGKSLRAKGLSTRVAACDESFNSWAVSSWDALTSEAKGYVMRLNTHCYGGSSQHWVNHRATRDTKRVWMSEYGDGDATGMTTAHQIVNDLRNMMPTAWVYWQAIDGGYGWGCVDMNLNAKSLSYTINRKYYAFGQFSQFIRPGATFVSVGDGNSVCAMSPTSVVIVTVNDKAQTVNYDLSRFTRLGARVSVYQTSPAQNLARLAPITISNKAFSADLPDQSVTTFVISDFNYSGKATQGFQTLTSSRSGQLLNVPGGSWNVGQFVSTASNRPTYDQQWRVEGSGDGWYKLCNRDSGQYLALWDDATHHNPVLQWTDNGDSTLLWGLNKQSDGTYVLPTWRHQDQCITENPTRGNGWPDVAAYNWYGGAEQKWYLTHAAPLYPPLERVGTLFGPPDGPQSPSLSP